MNQGFFFFFLCRHNRRALLHEQKRFCPQAIYSRLVTYSLQHSAASALASSLKDLALSMHLDDAKGHETQFLALFSVIIKVQ